MWGRYIHPGAGKSSCTLKHFRRLNDNPAFDQSQPSISFSQPSHMNQGIHFQSPEPSPAPKPNMIHQFSDSLGTNHIFAAKKHRSYIPGTSSNIRQYHQLERDVTFKSKPSMSSMTDTTPNNSHIVEMIEQNPESMTPISQHLHYDTGEWDNDASTLESEADRLRNERDDAFNRAARLAEDLALADQEIRRVYMNLSDLGTENSTLKWTVHSLEKEVQLAQARVIDAQRQASTAYPPHNSYIYHEGPVAELAEVQERYSREHRHLERLEEERKALLDDNQDLQKIIEGFKDAEMDLKQKLRSYRTDNEVLRERLAAAGKFARSESMLDQEMQEMESEKNQFAHLIRGKEEAERALELFKKAVNVGPDLINAFSELEVIAVQGGRLESRKRTPKGSSPTGSSGHFTHRSGNPSVPTPKRPRYQ
jgi:predicted  nucleic acid-binding Zn-ribbon protein